MTTAQLVNYFLKYDGWRIVKYKQEVYYFNGYFFKKLSEEEFAAIMIQNPTYSGETSSKSLNVLRNVYEKVRLSITQIVPDHYIFNKVAFLNGLYDLSTGEFAPYDYYGGCNFFPAKNAAGGYRMTPMNRGIPTVVQGYNRQSIYIMNYFFTYYINANYNRGNCQCFDKFLNYISGGDATLIDRIWEVLGYYLTPDMSKKCFIVLYGVGNSGKSVLGEFLRALFNDEAVTTISIDDFHSTVFAKKLIDRNLALSMELSSEPLDSKIVRGIKNATGNDMLTAGKVNFRNQCKLLFASNYPLITKSPSSEFQDRFVPIPFQYTVPEEQRDNHLLQKFMQEKDGIVFNAMRAYQRLKKNAYNFSGNFPKNDPELFPSADPYGNKIVRFLKQYCIIGERESRTTTDDLFEVFQYSEYSDPDIDVTVFGRKLRQVLECVYPNKTNQNHWYTGTNDNGKKVYKWGHVGIKLNDAGN